MHDERYLPTVAGVTLEQKMKKVSLLAIFCAVLGTGSFAQSGVVNGAFAGCLTEDLLSEFITAAVNNDNRQLNSLLQSGCYNIDGREYSVVSRGFTRSQLRIYAGGSSVVLWTVSEAISR